MAFIAALLGLLCCIVVLVEMPTGSLTPQQLLAIAGIFFALAIFLPRSWPNFPNA